MSGVSATVKDYRIHNLQKEYGRYSDAIYRLQSHIVSCYENSIINVNEKNTYLKTLTDQVKQMNTRYNNCMNELCEESDLNNKPLNEILEMLDFSQGSDNDINNELDEFIDVYRLFNKDCSNTALQAIMENPFDEINDELLKVGESCGFPSVHLGLELLFGIGHKHLYSESDNEQLNMYNRVFIPLGYKTKKLTDVNGNINIQKIVSSVDCLIDNMAELNVKRSSDRGVVFTGYFGFDSLNLFVRTSQICNHRIFQKKKAIEVQLEKRSDINEKFRKSYLRHVSISNLLGLTEEQFVRQVEHDYAKYRRLVGSSFMNLMKEFSKDNIKNMYDIIRLLLFGTEENANVAGVMFGLTKDKKSGSDTIANIIYRNLNHISQIKLRKTNINIKNELDKIKALSIDDVDMKKQIALCKNMPPEVKRCCIDKAEEMKASNNDYYKQQLYVRTLLNFPWTSKEDDTFFADIGQNKGKSREFLDNLMGKLNDRAYGHKECKEQIRDLMAQWLKNPASAGSAIGLVGPPGVGKTMIAKGIGEALGIPLVQITLGGQNDAEVLLGHGYTYSSAQPGLVVKKLVEAGNSRCVLYFDELDKTSEKHSNDEIQNTLINMTDPNTNGEFSDRFFGEIKFSLKKVLFVFSYNDHNRVNPTLLSRIDEKEVKPYSVPDKVTIARDYMMREICDTIGFDKGAIKIEDKELEYLADEYVNEAGVRELKRKLTSIFLKLNIDRIYDQGPFKDRNDFSVDDPIIVTREMIEGYLDKPKVSIEKIHEYDSVGIINGLYAVPGYGKGGIIPIQVYHNKTVSDQKFKLHLTGSQGKVMKESVQTALTAALNYLNPKIVKKFIRDNPHGFHIHTPSGGCPKDGPSAGAAFATAFASRILDKPIHRDFGITGEIELPGNITKIGGLVYKLTGAKKAGIKTVLVCEENREDVDEIKKEHADLFEDGFNTRIVKTLIDVFHRMIIGFDDDLLNPNIPYLTKRETKTASAPSSA